MLTENPIGSNVLPPFNPKNQNECFKLAQEAYSNSLVSYKHTEMLAKRIITPTTINPNISFENFISD